ncbi:hypothetical protein L2755_10670 [Shewanella abyssi]|uniref:hypothetical protein n=1 Tax=Shewanella abyssi TaxID=311789 RepID=UPI00200F0693|nr:hypothetical protein [Shewanella abyssi]MCL1050086.1 hypothetical protein [Shewanella abyssi]
MNKAIKISNFLVMVLILSNISLNLKPQTSNLKPYNFNSLTILNLAVADEGCFGGDLCVERPKPMPEHRPCTDCGGSGDQGSGSGDLGGGSGSQGSNNGSDSSSTATAKTQRQICLEKSAVQYAICRATKTANYATTLQMDCLGQATISTGGNAVFVDAGISIDEYNQCKDLAASKRDNGIDVCNVFQASRAVNCP